MYTVSREEPPEAYESLGLQIDLCGTSTATLDDNIHICQELSTQIDSAKCNKTSCLNAFNTSLMPTLSYRIIATQFTEQQWNKAIHPAIQVTCNAAGMAKNFFCVVLFGPQE